MRWHRAWIRSFVLSMALVVIVGGCHNPDEPVLEDEANYFPLKIGVYQIYDVKETRIDQINTVELAYQLRTEVTDSFPNQNGGYTYVLTRSKRNTPSLPWTPLNAWSARTDDKHLVVNEENIPYVKLAFPFAEGKSWNGNLMNAQGGKENCGTTQESCDIYTLEGLSEPFETSTGQSFEKTVTVIQSNDKDVIVGQDVRKEIYALGTGLIYKESTILEYCSVGSCAGKQEVIKGFIYKQVISEYGGY